MDKRVTYLLSALVVIVAIGVGLYANELSRQAAQRRAAIRAGKEAELNDGIRVFNKAIALWCHPGSENIKADVHAKPDSPEWDKWQCENANAAREDDLQAVKKLEEEDR